MTTCYRVQPIDADLHGIQTETSAGQRADGVHVFASLGEVDVSDWCDDDEPVELATIECVESDLRDSGDAQGYLLRRGRGEITERRSFTGLAALQEYARLADSMIQRARRLGAFVQTVMARASADPLHRISVTDSEQRALEQHPGERPGGGTMTLFIEPYDTARGAGLRASHVRAEQCAEVLGILQHESSAGADFRQYILVYLA